MTILERQNEASKRYYRRNRKKILERCKQKREEQKADRLKERINRLQNQLKEIK